MPGNTHGSFGQNQTLKINLNKREEKKLFKTHNRPKNGKKLAVIVECEIFRVMINVKATLPKPKTRTVRISEPFRRMTVTHN